MTNISTCRGCPYCRPSSKPTFRQWLRQAVLLFLLAL